jgi:RNA polymerase sigma-70 factor (ECF subfamily)
MPVNLEAVRDLDTALVHRVQEGDREAFEALYRQHHDRLYRFCKSRVSNAGDAEDITQEAFVRAWRHIETLGGERLFYPWLRRIAQNLCVDHGRRQGRTTPVPEPDLGGASGGQEEAVVRADDLRMLDLALGRLSARNRQALEQRERDEWSYERIAEHAGVTVPAVESLLWRARQALRREFAAVAGEGGLLSGIPVIGWVYRRAQRAARKMPAWVTPDLGTAVGSAFAAVAMGTVLVFPGAGGGGSGAVGRLVTPVAVSIATGAPAADAATAVTATLLATGSVAPSSGGSGTAPAATGDESASRLRTAVDTMRPEVLTYEDEHKQASSAPIYAEIGGVGNVSAAPLAAISNVQEGVQALIPPTNGGPPIPHLEESQLP